MSVLIKGMKMPASCYECVLGHAVDGCDSWYGKEVSTTARPINCPLVEVPTPHGRLIDGDAFVHEISDRIDAAIKWGGNAMADRNDEAHLRAGQAIVTFCEASLTAKKMPTIIKAEEGEAHETD